eukprot:TRINITY_DN2107_c0_g1_i2.p1 TRINITY_DN2107_c0_g1~~TRINITY_DN2107_c0_g1_i2.p1  ORF type:complete len:124 (-),score=5.11 TRINITY_DN2107_c0_g1_i2:38-409(-)
MAVMAARPVLSSVSRSLLMRVWRTFTISDFGRPFTKITKMKPNFASYSSLSLDNSALMRFISTSAGESFSICASLSRPCSLYDAALNLTLFGSAPMRGCAVFKTRILSSMLHNLHYVNQKELL